MQLFTASVVLIFHFRQLDGGLSKLLLQRVAVVLGLLKFKLERFDFIFGNLQCLILGLLDRILLDLEYRLFDIRLDLSNQFELQLSVLFLILLKRFNVLVQTLDSRHKMGIVLSLKQTFD
jgi:hypothetical protein